jgi:uncharacterized protein (DUF1778 family)
MPTRAASAQKASPEPKRDTLNLRISPTDRLLIDGAAGLAGKTRTDFVLDAVRRAAEETYLERRLFVVGPEAYDAFVERLDSPPVPNPRLDALMRTKAPWEA